jgi:cytochrome b561
MTKIQCNDKKLPRRLTLVLTLDAGLLAIACLLENVPLTGLRIHEWLALGTVGLILLHLLLSWTWIVASLRRLAAPGAWRNRINYLLNFSLFASVVTVVFSGVMLSEAALPAFGLRIAPGDISWRYVHNRFSNYFLILVGLHLALNWDWSVAAVRRLSRAAGR